MGGNEDAMAQEDYDNLPLPTVQIFSKGDQSTSTCIESRGKMAKHGWYTWIK